MSTSAKVHTLADVVHSITRRFSAARLSYGHGTRNAREEAVWLVLHACRIPFDALDAKMARPVTRVEMQRIERLAQRRVRDRIPAAYLTREAWLGEFSFYVDRRVIVPRSFIAELLPHDVVSFLRAPVRTALDLCTGSGCLAVLMAHTFPKAHIDAADLSAGALAVAKRNIARYNLMPRIHPLRSDLFSSLSGRRYDLIVSNPPYVRAASMKGLPDEYLAEPRMALAGGDDGLALVRRILGSAGKHLNPRGALICEIGHNRKALERAFPRTAFTWLETSAGDGLVFLLERKQLPS